MKKSILRVLLIVGLILLVPVFGNLFVEGWNWGPEDFAVAFVALFAAGLAIDFAARRIASLPLRAVAIAAVVLAVLALWSEAVGGLVSRTLGSLLG